MNRNTSVHLARRSALTAAWLLLNATLPATAFHLHELEALGHLGGASSRAAAINNHDAIVGESETADGSLEAFLWTPGEGMRALGTLGGTNSRAYDLNDDNLVVGEATGPDGLQRAFVWTATTGMQPLPVPEPVLHSAALAVNAAGQIIGTLEDERGAHAVLWAGTNMTRLHRLPGPGTIQPLDLNNTGDVVGLIGTGADEPGSALAFFFKGGAVARNLAEFRLLSAQGGSAAVAVNAHAVVAGYLMLDSTRVRAFRYDPQGGLVQLDDRGALFTTASDINDQGAVAGSIIASYAADEAACLWMDDRWYNLNETTRMPPDWSLIEAVGINQRGCLTGYGLVEDRIEAFLLRPRPEARAEAWPDPVLRAEVQPTEDSSEHYAVLKAEIPSSLTVQRVLFCQDDQPLGAVEEPPFEWGWQGDRKQPVEFHLEVLETSGRLTRSARIILPVADHNP